MLSPHLPRPRLVDLAEGEPPDAAATEHLRRCARCRDDLGGLKAALALARDVPAEDPSPLFWVHFPERVASAVDGLRGRGGWRAWWNGRGGAAVRHGALWFGAAAVLLAVALRWALVPGIPGSRPPAASPAAVTAGLPPAGEAAGLEPLPADDASWLLILESGELDWDSAAATGLAAAPGTVERMASEMSAEEQNELLRLLREGIERRDRGAGL